MSVRERIDRWELDADLNHRNPSRRTMVLFYAGCGVLIGAGGLAAFRPEATPAWVGTAFAYALVLLATPVLVAGALLVVAGIATVLSEILS